MSLEIIEALFIIIGHGHCSMDAPDAYYPYPLSTIMPAQKAL